MTLFKNIPEEIEEQILSICDQDEEFLRVVRFIDHNSEPTKSDFLPSFVDPKSRLCRESMAGKGEMAKILSSQSQNEKLTMNDCCVSLRLPTTRTDFTNEFKKMRRHFPYIALGKTSKEKGCAYNNTGSHVMYFLKDYDENNPYSDFGIIEEELLWKTKSL